MANLQINIEVPEEEFKNFCVSRISELPRKELDEILLKSVEVALIQDKKNPSYNRDSCLLVEPGSNSYGTTIYRPTELMNKIVRSIETDNYFQDIVKEVVDYIKDNYVELVRKYIIEAFSNMLFSEVDKYNIQRFIQDSVNSAMKN